MDVPSLSAAHGLCQQLSQWMDAGEPVVLHCKAGLGRIQSEKQLEFVGAFWAYAQAMGGRVTPDSEGGVASADGARPFVDETLHS